MPWEETRFRHGRRFVRCPSCDSWKRRAAFGRDRSKTGGLKTHCRDCRSAKYYAQVSA